MAAKEVKFSTDARNRDAARGRHPGGRREGDAGSEGPQRGAGQVVRRAADHQGRRDGRQGDRAQRQVREHGRADGARSREQDQRHRRRRHDDGDRSGAGDRARGREGGGRRHEPDGPQARHRSGRGEGRRGDQEAVEEDQDSNSEVAQVGTIAANGEPRSAIHRQGDGKGRQRGRDHGRGGEEPGDRARRRRGHAVRPRLPLAVFHHQCREDGVRAGEPDDPAARDRSCRACSRCCRCWKRWCSRASRC